MKDLVVVTRPERRPVRSVDWRIIAEQLRQKWLYGQEDPGRTTHVTLPAGAGLYMLTLITLGLITLGLICNLQSPLTRLAPLGVRWRDNL